MKPLRFRSEQSSLLCDRRPQATYEQFQIPIRLLNAAVRYKETKGDRRVLLELPIEERNLLEPLVSTKPE